MNIPRQTIYALETIGDNPSLRWVVNVARAKTLYPRDAQDAPPAPAPAGTQWAPVMMNRTPGRRSTGPLTTENPIFGRPFQA